MNTDKLTAEEIEFIEKSKNWKRYKVLRQLPDNGTSHAIIAGNCYYSGTFYDSEYNINELIEEGYIILYEEPFPFQKDLVGNNKRTVYCYCPQCKSFGVNTPLEMTCGNCGYTKTVTYYDAETINDYLEAYKNQSSAVSDEILQELGEKEVMIAAFAKIMNAFKLRDWIMQGRGCYPYNDDRYKEEVRYLYDEIEKIENDTWKNIKTKTFEYREKIIAEYKKESASSEITEVWVKATEKDNQTIGYNIELADSLGWIPSHNGWLKKVKLSSVSSESNVGGMRWVKASERLPEKEGIYYGKGWGLREWILKFKDGQFFSHNDRPLALPFDNKGLEWLDESIPSEVKEKEKFRTYHFDEYIERVEKLMEEYTGQALSNAIVNEIIEPLKVSVQQYWRMAQTNHENACKLRKQLLDSSDKQALIQVLCPKCKKDTLIRMSNCVCCMDSSCGYSVEQNNQ